LRALIMRRDSTYHPTQEVIETVDGRHSRKATVGFKPIQLGFPVVGIVDADSGSRAVGRDKFVVVVAGTEL
jgi:hypothetical protein